MTAVVGELLGMHALRCASDRVWEFYIPLFIASSFATETRDLAPAGALYAAQAVACVLFSGPVAAWFKGRRRSGAAFVLLLALENAAVLLGGHYLLHAPLQPLQSGWGIFANLRFTASCASLALYAVLGGCLQVVFGWDLILAMFSQSSPIENCIFQTTTPFFFPIFLDIGDLLSGVLSTPAVGQDRTGQDRASS